MPLGWADAKVLSNPNTDLSNIMAAFFMHSYEYGCPTSSRDKQRWVSPDNISVTLAMHGGMWRTSEQAGSLLAAAHQALRCCSVKLPHNPHAIFAISPSNQLRLSHAVSSRRIAIEDMVCICRMPAFPLPCGTYRPCYVSQHMTSD